MSIHISIHRTLETQFTTFELDLHVYTLYNKKLFSEMKETPNWSQHEILDLNLLLSLLSMISLDSPKLSDSPSPDLSLSLLHLSLSAPLSLCMNLKVK